MNDFLGIQDPVSKLWLYKPQPKQKIFHDSVMNRRANGLREFFYGGSARGGKSFSMRWQCHIECLSGQNLHGLLLRYNYTELEKTHIIYIERGELPKEYAKYNQSKRQLKYCTGSILDLGYLENSDDLMKYLSTDYDFIFFDEVTEIDFDFVYSMKMRLTATNTGYIPFLMAASNPIGQSKKKVKEYFITKSVNKEDYPNYDPDRILFIPANIYDNEELIKKDPEIITRYKQMSKANQEVFLNGNWDYIEGAFFDFDAKVHIIEPKDYLPREQIFGMSLLAGMDYGNDTFVLWLARDFNGNIIVFDEWFDVKGKRPQKIKSLEKFVTDRGYKDIKIVADNNMWYKDGFDLEKFTIPADDFMRNKILRLVPVGAKKRNTDMKYRKLCWDAIKSGLYYELEGEEIVKQPQLKVYRRCTKLIEFFTDTVPDDNDIEEIHPKTYDHCGDGFKYAYMPLRVPKEKRTDDRPDWLKKMQKEQRAKQRESGFMTV